MKRVKAKVLSILLAIVMMLGLIPLSAITAYAAEAYTVDLTSGKAVIATKEEFWNLSNNKEFKEPHTLDVFNKSLENEIKDNEYIKVENINGPIIFFSSKDDSMWDSSKSVKRMVDRLKSNKFKYNYSSYEFDLGTHFLFPEPLIKKLGRFGGDLLTNQFISGRNNKKEVKETRIKIDEEIKIFFSKFVNTEK